MLAAGCLASGQARLAYALDEGQLALLRDSPAVLAIHHDSLPFSYLPSNAAQHDPCKKWSSPPSLDPDRPVKGKIGEVMSSGLILGLMEADLKYRFARQYKKCTQRQQARQSEAERIANGNFLQDPMPMVKARVLGELAEVAGMRNIQAIDDPVPRLDFSIADVKEKLVGSPILEFRPLEWGIERHEAAVWKAGVSGGVVVINVGDPGPPAVLTCHRSVRVDARFEGLVADNGALLRAKLNEAADACAGELLEGLLGARASKSRMAR